MEVPAAADLLWVDRPDDTTDERMAATGLRRVRSLVQLQRHLPLEPTARGGAERIRTRAFRPGRDDEGFLEANNAAFRWHPEQGRWDRDRLADALAADWVDLDGFLVHEDPDGRIDGFCWTRVHPATSGGEGDGDEAPRIGEIWVIATHPGLAPAGLGRSLVVAGLDHLAAQGITVGMLWTEEENAPARRLYDRLGFSVRHRRAGYR